MTTKVQPTAAAIGEAVLHLQLPNGHTISVGQEASVGFGDRLPAKVCTIQRVKKGWEINLQTFNYHASDEGMKIGMGHQEWVIDWDKPGRFETFKVDLKGEIINQYDGLHVTIGVARPHYNWSL